MTIAKLHEDEVDIDAGLVRRLLADQHPRWADLPVRPVDDQGTVNAVFRLGDAHSVRLPRSAAGVASLERERRWAPVLAAAVPVPLPEPVADGRPALGYPFPWTICRWLDGTPPVGPVDDDRLARDLAGLVRALRSIDAAGAPSSRRGAVALAGRDDVTTTAIGSLADAVDRGPVLAAWRDALDAPAWDGTPRWTHGDLLPPNLLVVDGRLAGVLDLGGIGVGDPACDLLPAWSALTGPARSTFRHALGVDDGTWRRGRGWALSIAALIEPYYRHTHPAFAAMAVRTLAQVVADRGGSDGPR